MVSCEHNSKGLTVLLQLCQNRTKPITIVNQRRLFQFWCARTSVLTMIIATRTSNSNSAYRDIYDEIDANNKIWAQTWNAWRTLDNSTSHCLILVNRSLRRRNPLMPFLFEHFLSTWSILSNSLVLRQIVRSGRTLVAEETNLWRESRIDRKLVGRSSSLRLYFWHKSTTIFAILASLCITILHSSLHCFTSWGCTRQTIVRGNVWENLHPAWWVLEREDPQLGL